MLSACCLLPISPAWMPTLCPFTLPHMWCSCHLDCPPLVTEPTVPTPRSLPECLPSWLSYESMCLAGLFTREASPVAEMDEQNSGKNSSSRLLLAFGETEAKREVDRQGS